MKIGPLPRFLGSIFHMEGFSVMSKAVGPELFKIRPR